MNVSWGCWNIRTMICHQNQTLLQGEQQDPDIAQSHLKMLQALTKLSIFAMKFFSLPKSS